MAVFERPVYANREGDFTVDIYRHADALEETLPNSPLNLTGYECAIIEAHIPKLMWNSSGVGITYRYSGDTKDSRITFRLDWFSSLQDLIDWVNSHWDKNHLMLEIDSFVKLSILGSSDEEKGTFVKFDVAVRNMFGFEDSKYPGGGTSWVTYIAANVPTFYREKSRFIALDCEFIAPSRFNGKTVKRLALLPLNASADYGHLAASVYFNNPIYHRLEEKVFEKIRIYIKHPASGQVFYFGNAHSEPVGAYIRLHFRPIASVSKFKDRNKKHHQNVLSMDTQSSWYHG